MSRRYPNRCRRAVHAAGAAAGVLIAALPLSGPAASDTYTPTIVRDNAGADGNWSSAGWDDGSEPNAGSLAAINNGATVTIDQPGETAARLRLASTSADSGFVEMVGGSLTLGTELRVGDEGVGTWTQSGGDLVSENVLWIGARGPGFDAAGVGTFNLSGGTVTVNGTSSTAMRIGRAGGTGVLNHSDGSFTTAGQFNIAARPAAEGLPSSGTYNLSGDAVLSVGGTLLNDATGDDPGEALLQITGSQASITTLSYAHRPDATLSFIADAEGVSPITVLDGPGGVSLQDGQLLVDLSAMTATPSAIVLIDNQQPDPVAGTFLDTPEGTAFGDYTLTYAYDGGDGQANDIALILAGALTGDLNGDGFVGAGDLDILLGVWNQNDTGPADLNEYGFIGAGDLDILLGNWNAGTAPSSAGVVPEPAGLTLMAAGLAALARRRNRD